MTVTMHCGLEQQHLWMKGLSTNHVHNFPGIHFQYIPLFRDIFQLYPCFRFDPLTQSGIYHSRNRISLLLHEPEVKPKASVNNKDKVSYNYCDTYNWLLTYPIKFFCWYQTGKMPVMLNYLVASKQLLLDMFNLTFYRSHMAPTKL